MFLSDKENEFMKNNFNLEHTTSKTQFAVFGLGKFGTTIVKELIQHDQLVWCCDVDELAAQNVSSYTEHVMQADASNDSFLDKIGIENFDVAIVAFSKSFESSVLTTMKLKERNVPFIIVKASDQNHKKVLESIGADHVILPEIVMAKRLAHSLVFDEPLNSIYGLDYPDIFIIKPKKKWIGKDLKSLQLTTKNRISILRIIRDGNPLPYINADTILLEKDTLIAIKT